MAVALFTLIAVFAVALGGRDQLIIARFASELERTNGLLAVGIVTACTSSGVAAFAGAALAAAVPETALHGLVAASLAAAACALILPVQIKPMKEPTRSYVAIGIVLLARQLIDAPRLTIFVFAAAATPPALAALTGAVAGAAAMALGWRLGERLETTFPLRSIRLTLAALLLVAALFIAITARYTIY